MVQIGRRFFACCLLAMLACGGVAVAAPAELRITLHPFGRAPVTVVAEVARTPEERARGLMFRKHLPDGRGMWFIFPTDVQHAFWMKNVPIPLDILFIGADLRVVDIIPNAQPFSEALLVPKKPYRYVLEVPGGCVRRHRVILDDQAIIFYKK